MAVNPLGNPLRVIISAGQVADIAQAATLIEDQPTDFILADKGYDADAFVEMITAKGRQTVIPQMGPHLFGRNFHGNKWSPAR